MSKARSCPLCREDAELFKEGAGKYYECGCCRAIFLDPCLRLSKEDEKLRYLQHNNDVSDIAYQNFVAPVVGEVEKKFVPGHHQGLDLGCGPGPVVAKLLRDRGYVIELYDPVFFRHPEKLQKTYDFIVCCEVIEHFYDPDQEFALSKSLLRPGGSLICMTHVYTEEIDFKKWYYKNDPTHVIFYRAKTFEWIRDRFAFSAVDINGRVITLQV